jgi:hypothetical protein
MTRFNIADDVWEAAVDEIFDLLLAVARRRTTTTYSDVVSRMRTVHLEPDSHAFHSMLGDASRRAFDEGGPLLSVVVLGRETHRPGGGFFDLARDLGFDVGEGRDDEGPFLGRAAQTGARLVAPPMTVLVPGDRAPDPTTSLVVVPCSGRKTAGGQRALDGPTIFDLLDSDAAARLREARNRLAGSAAIDESALLPACERYTGTLYQSAHGLVRTTRSGRPPIIVSGGYGLALRSEPIGMYNRVFSLRDWPEGLLEQCLVQVAHHFDVRNVIGFCAQSTGYAELLRRIAWARCPLKGWLATPELGGRGGAQVLVPRASGQAFDAFLAGNLHDRWTSTDGVPVRVRRLG